jgi:hypothetical protein
MLRDLKKLLSDICYRRTICTWFHIVKLNLEKLFKLLSMFLDLAVLIRKRNGFGLVRYGL